MKSFVQPCHASPQVNKIPVSLLGVYLFKTVITAQGAMYIIISMCGGFIYSVSTRVRTMLNLSEYEG